MKPVCVPCRRFFRVKKNGYYFIEGMPRGGTRPAPGTADPGAWMPYKLWVGDLWECRGCGATILSGFGSAPRAVRHQDDFAETVRLTGADQLQVNDC